MTLQIRTKVSYGDEAIEDWDDFIDNMSFGEALRIEAVADMPFEQWVAQCYTSTMGRMVTAWLVKSQRKPDIRLGEVQALARRQLNVQVMTFCPVCGKDAEVRRKFETDPESGKRKFKEHFCVDCDHVYADDEEAEPEAPKEPRPAKRSRNASVAGS